MSTSEQQLAPVALMTSALWCQAAMRAICHDPDAILHVIVGDQLVPCVGRRIGHGQVRVGISPAWRWPSSEPDIVGELVLHHCDSARGMQLVGWWSEVLPELGDPHGAYSVLALDVAGITLWESPRHASTEDSALIAALLR